MIRFQMNDLIRKAAMFRKEQEQLIHDVTTKVTLDLGKGLKEQSPVDEGDFRDAWDIEEPAKPGDSGRVTNNSPYAIPLANGHSGQAPAGWVENECEAVARQFRGAT